MESNPTKIVARSSKRKADEAFGKRQKPAPPMQQADKKSLNKVVNFQDDDTGNSTDAILNGNKNNVVHEATRSSPGRLKKRAEELLKIRQSLPIYPHAKEVRSKLASHDVLLLVGETGSGKSTQVPQFLLDQSYTRRMTAKTGPGNIGGCIAITQPRRVAAISLARRVAEEMGTPLGNSSPASQVGYSVRFDTSTGPNTRIKFLTDGMLLQELLRDPWLKEYSVVVVDEVHERGVNVDLVMGFLRRIIEGRNKKDGRNGIPLKVIVMSATADMERIEAFFSSQKVLNGTVEGVNGNNSVNEADDFRGFSDDGEQPPTENASTKSPVAHLVRATSCFIKGRQYPVTISYSPQPVESSWDAAMERIMQLHQHTPLPGDILVFLPGQEAIDSLESTCNSYANSLTEQSKQKGAPKIPKLLILPLFAALPTAAQQRVFEPTPPFTRKIILSTNIAETSVTVPGIRHVIDTGKRKARFFRPALNLDTLLTKPISRSSAKQRTGRAGREAPGSCWRLYTEKTFYELDADTEPEILRCDLSQLVLTLKAHDIEDILSFPLLTQPPVKALERALLHLLHLKALDPTTGQITPLGRRIASLPLPANLARILLASTEPQHSCLPEITDIVSGLSVENIWLPVHNQRQHPDTASEPTNTEDEPTNPIELARRTLYRRSGDHLTLLAAIQAYTTENTNRKTWCQRHGISHRAMSAAMDVRKQLTKLMAEGGRYHHHHPLPPTTTSVTSSSATSDLETRILKTLLTGLHTNTAHLVSTTLPSISSSTAGSAPTATGPYRTYYTSKPLNIHPSSVLFTREHGSRATDVMFSEFVYTSRPYARCVSAVEGVWVEEVMREVSELGDA